MKNYTISKRIKSVHVCCIFQCSIDLWTIAQAYVFFEKLILKVGKHKLTICSLWHIEKKLLGARKALIFPENNSHAIL